jgi:DUF4097 and DUF4098 domain-containing protein YvlB
MSAKLLLPALAAGMLLLSGCDIEELQGYGRYTRDFHYSYPLDQNGKLAIETFNGSIEVSTWDQKTVDISGTKYGPSQEAADNLPVSIDQTPAAVSVRVVRQVGWQSRNTGARLVVKIPSGAAIDRLVASNGGIRTMGGVGPARIKTSNGTVHVTDLAGNLDAETSNGGMDLVNIAGDVVARTSNGRIHAGRVKGSLEAVSSNGGITAELIRGDRPARIETSNGGVDLTLPEGLSSDVRASTSNSGITVRLPAELNGRVRAHTSNSQISSAFELRLRGEISKNHVDAVLGSGAGPLIDLSSSNGAIRLARL